MKIFSERLSHLFLPERIIFKSPHLIDEFIFFVLNLYAYFSRYPSNRDVHRHFFFSNVSLYNGLLKPSFILKVLLFWSDFFYYNKTWNVKKYRFEYVTEKHLPDVYLLSLTEVKWQTLPERFQVAKKKIPFAKELSFAISSFAILEEITFVIGD